MKQYSVDKQQCIVGYLESVQVRLVALRELQSATGEELRPFFGQTLLPSVLRPSRGAFKGEL